MIRKVVESAIANAENNQGADVDELKVKTIMVDEGPTLKRFMARAKGRGTRILKRTSHITVVVGEGNRSEEHTSELQSLMRISYAVFCLKKKKNHYITDHQQ